MRCTAYKNCYKNKRIPSNCDTPPETYDIVSWTMKNIKHQPAMYIKGQSHIGELSKNSKFWVSWKKHLRMTQCMELCWAIYKSMRTMDHHCDLLKVNLQHQQPTIRTCQLSVVTGLVEPPTLGNKKMMCEPICHNLAEWSSATIYMMSLVLDEPVANGYKAPTSY